MRVSAVATSSVDMATQSAVEVYGRMADSGQCAMWLHCRQYVIACILMLGISQTCKVFICIEGSDF
jgi:TRAP-type mannitol/chloroaromatic compound transport system permease small subunit